MAEQGLNPGKAVLDIAGIPIDSGVLFSDHKNVYRKGTEKRQRKLFEKIAFIKPFLQEGEKVLLVTTGCSHMSFFEQLLTGWIVYHLKRALFVFTDRRIFHIPTTSDYGYRNSIARMAYADCQSLRLKGRTLTVKYKNGKGEKFNYIAGKEGKKIKALLKSASLDGVPSKAAGRIHLCPRCGVELIADQYRCPNCRLEFKDRATGKRLSILYPGGGYFYTGHWVMGMMDAFAETILLVMVIASLLDVLRDGSGIGPLVFFSVALVFEKLETIYHLDHFVKEYVPIRKEILPIVSAK